MLKNEPSGINSKDSAGKTLLWYYANKPEVVLKLLKMGASPHIKDIGEILNIAITASYHGTHEIKEVMTLIIDAGIQLIDEKGETLLKHCVRNLDLLLHMLKLGVDIHFPEFQDVLANILYSKHVKEVREVLDIASAAGLKLVDQQGNSLLKYCTIHPQSFLHLLHLGADPHFDQIGDILAYFVQRDCPVRKEVLRICAAAGVNLVDSTGISLLKHTVTQPEIFLHLLKLGADMPTDSFNDTIKEIISMGSSYSYYWTEDQVIQLINMLLANGLKIDENECGCLLSYCYGRLSVMKHMINLFGVTNITNFGITLHKMICYGHTISVISPILDLLLSVGVKLEDEDGVSLLKYCTRNSKLMLHLLKLKADPLVEDKRLLYKVVKESSSQENITELIEMLIKAGHTLFFEDKDNCTVFCHALQRYLKDPSDHSLKVVEIILKNMELQNEFFQFQCKIKYHPQDILLEYSLSVDISATQLEEIFRLYFTSKFKELDHTTLIPPQLISISRQTTSFCPCPFNFLSAYMLYIPKRVYDEHGTHWMDKSKLLNLLFQIGFSISPQSSITPFSALILIPQHNHNYAEELLSQGSNVEQELLKLRNKTLQTWKTTLHIPDAILVSMLYGIIKS